MKCWRTFYKELWTTPCSVIHTASTGRWQQSWPMWRWRAEEAGKAENVAICSLIKSSSLCAWLLSSPSFKPPAPLCAPTPGAALAGEEVEAEQRRADPPADRREMLSASWAGMKGFQALASAARSPSRR